MTCLGDANGGVGEALAAGVGAATGIDGAGATTVIATGAGATTIGAGAGATTTGAGAMSVAAIGGDASGGASTRGARAGVSAIGSSGGGSKIAAAAKFAATGAATGAVTGGIAVAAGAGGVAVTFCTGAGVGAGAGAAVTGDLIGGSSALGAGEAVAAAGAVFAAGAVDFGGAVGGVVEREGCDCTDGTTEIRAGSDVTEVDVGACWAADFAVDDVTGIAGDSVASSVGTDSRAGAGGRTEADLVGAPVTSVTEMGATLAGLSATRATATGDGRMPESVPGGFVRAGGGVDGVLAAASAAAGLRGRVGGASVGARTFSISTTGVFDDHEGGADGMLDARAVAAAGAAGADEGRVAAAGADGTEDTRAAPVVGAAGTDEGRTAAIGVGAGGGCEAWRGGGCSGRFGAGEALSTGGSSSMSVISTLSSSSGGSGPPPGGTSEMRPGGGVGVKNASSGTSSTRAASMRMSERYHWSVRDVGSSAISGLPGFTAGSTGPCALAGFDGAWDTDAPDDAVAGAPGDADFVALAGVGGTCDARAA